MFSPVSVYQSILSVIFLRGMLSSSVILVLETLKTPSTFFYYLQIFVFGSALLFMPILDVAMLKEACVQSTQKFNDKVNLTLNSVY
jgi:hypothetical protein